MLLGAAWIWDRHRCWHSSNFDGFDSPHCFFELFLFYALLCLALPSLLTMGILARNVRYSGRQSSIDRYFRRCYVLRQKSTMICIFVFYETIFGAISRASPIFYTCVVIPSRQFWPLKWISFFPCQLFSNRSTDRVSSG